MQLPVVDAPRTARVVPFSWQPTVTAGDLLAAPGPVVVPPDWWSWAGAHGGLVVALAAADAADATGADAAEATLRSSTAQLLRPVRGPLELASTVVHGGRRITTVRTEGTVEGHRVLVVHSTFGAPGGRTGADGRAGPAVTPTAGEVSASPSRRATAGGVRRDPAPSAHVPGRGASDPQPAPLVHQPEDLERFELPAAMVPFGDHVDIRPTDEVLPLTGAPTARLTAWVRLRDEGGAPGPLRTTVLADALAPSLYAALAQPAPVPTVELAIHHRAPAAPADDDPWLLVRARTDWSDEGWVSEALDLWDRAGAHVATSRQLRLVTAS